METAAAVLQVILAFVFLGAGGSKVLGVRMQVDNFNVYGYPQWFRVVTGLVELTGAAAMLVGLLVDEVAVFGGVWLGVTMVGAVYTDLFRRGSAAYAVAPAILLVLALAVVALRVG
ncbi:MAG TPA: DoxX family protein [Dehalococcoidia bacterium]|nr:DoxX family protein [Dehalococcoidia bacterium]